MTVVISNVFPHTLSILGPLCAKCTLKWSTILPMQITCMHLHITISCECLVTHRTWKWPNLLLQCLPPPCNNTSIIRVSPCANSQGQLTQSNNSLTYIDTESCFIYIKNDHHTALNSYLHTFEYCWSTNTRFLLLIYS